MAKRTNLYHSALVKMGRITVKVVTKPTKSQFPNKPNYCQIDIGTEQYSYSCENAACEHTMAQYVGQTIEVEATGREGDAVIQVFGGQAPAASTPPQTRQQPSQPSKPATPPQQPAQPKPTTTNGPGMRCRQVEYRRVVNLGNYCSEAIGVIVELEEGTKAADALAYAKHFVEGHLAKAGVDGK